MDIIGVAWGCKKINPLLTTIYQNIFIDLFTLTHTYKIVTIDDVGKFKLHQ